MYLRSLSRTLRSFLLIPPPLFPWMRLLLVLKSLWRSISKDPVRASFHAGDDEEVWFRGEE